MTYLFIIAAIVCAVLAAFGFRPDMLLPLAVAFLAAAHLPWANIRRPLG